MTTRRLNHTDRQRIRLEDARISLLSPEAGLTEFSAVLRLKEYGFPDEALVVVEAQRQTSVMRFDFGTISYIRPPETCTLDEFEPPVGVQFRVKVIEPGNESGRLLGLARAIRPALVDAGSQEGILPVRPAELGGEIWRLELSGDEAPPQLLINKRIASWRALPKDPQFAAFVLPNVFRQILTDASKDGPPSADSWDSWDWMRDWCEFAERLPGVDPVPDLERDRLSWIDRATDSFARSQGYLERVLKLAQEEA